jgi:hypothetical protein
MPLASSITEIIKEYFMPPTGIFRTAHCVPGDPGEAHKEII